MNLIMRGTLAKRGLECLHDQLLAIAFFIKVVTIWLASRFQTHLKLRNECEILKNEIYSVKSELKVFIIYFLNWELRWNHSDVGDNFMLMTLR